MPLGAQYANFVTRELMPFIERHYPVARGAANTGFGGSSYGAIAALYTALVKPGKFGRLLIESPSLYVGSRYLLRQAQLAQSAGRHGSIWASARRRPAAPTGTRKR